MSEWEEDPLIDICKVQDQGQPTGPKYRLESVQMPGYLLTS